jgi:non-ribosomal peptide synthetase component E (peptide arylation enzyme)
MTTDPKTLCDSLRLHAAKKPHETALHHGHATLSYSALNETSTNLARWFLDRSRGAVPALLHKLQRPDRLIWLQNNLVGSSLMKASR